MNKDTMRPGADRRTAYVAGLYSQAEAPAQMLILLSILKDKGVLDDNDLEEFNVGTKTALDLLVTVMDAVQQLYTASSAGQAHPEAEALCGRASKALDDVAKMLPVTPFVQNLISAFKDAEGVVERTGELSLLSRYADEVMGGRRSLPQDLNPEMAGRVLQQLLLQGPITPQVVGAYEGAIGAMLNDFLLWKAAASG